MEFLPEFNIETENYNIVDINNYNIRFGIRHGDLLSLSCTGYTGKWIKFKISYCDEKKIIIPFEFVNNVFNKNIDVYFEYFNDSSEEPLFKIYLTNFKFIGYLNLFGFFNDTKLDEINDSGISIDEEDMVLDYNFFNNNNVTNGDEIKVLYTFDGFRFENCDIDKIRKNKINTIIEPSINFNTFVGKENILVFGEGFEIKKVNDTNVNTSF